jgi:hypothetical protein
MVENGTCDARTNGPSQNDWDDFLRIRPCSGSVVNLVASGYTIQNESTKDVIEAVPNILYLVHNICT